MPELPEVEVFRKFIERYALGRRIQAVEVNQHKILAGLTAQALEKKLVGGQIAKTQRRGKQLFVKIVQPKQSVWLLFHFGMTGYLSWSKDEKTAVNAYGDPKRPLSHIRVQFHLDDGSELSFHEQRMFGKLTLIDNLDSYLANSKLGPDALAPTFDEKAFLTALQRLQWQIKPALMDQSVISGIGNVYADEILYQCGVHPERSIASLSASDLKCLYLQMKTVLQNTVDCNADRDCLPASYLLHYRKAKAKCPKDKAPIKSKTVGGRTTYFCPVCQPL
ncbi:MAG TPA: DNA-formamidopyrimidine glycosylase [Oculatellaceae cyanobacterium]